MSYSSRTDDGVTDSGQLITFFCRLLNASRAARRTSDFVEGENKAEQIAGNIYLIKIHQGEVGDYLDNL